MKDWDIWVNSRPEFRSGSLVVSDEPLWLWFAYKTVQWFMFPTLLGFIPLPNWPKCIRYEYDGHVEWNTPAEWYGDLQGLWHAWVSNPIFQRLWVLRRQYETQVDMGYDQLKKLFEKSSPEFSEFFARQDADAERAALEDESD